MEKNKSIAIYKDIQGRDVELTLEYVRRVLPTLAKAKDDDVINFALKCKEMGLNPLLDVHNATFGDGGNIIPIVKKDYYIQNATKNPDYKGYEAGIIVEQQDGRIEQREGCFAGGGEMVVGGWAKVHTASRGDFYSSVSVEEYAMLKQDGTMNSMWQRKTGTMIRKVALSQALREAFPMFIGTYDQSEMDMGEQETIEVDAEVVNDTPHDVPTFPKHDVPTFPKTRKVEVKQEQTKPFNIFD